MLILAGLFGNWLGPALTSWIMGPIVIVWFASICFAGRIFICPRCGEPYFKDLFMHNSFSSYCFHCGLPKYSCDPDDPKSRIPDGALG